MTGQDLQLLGQSTGAEVDLRAVVAERLARRGIDPARIDEVDDVLDPRGNVMDREEAAAWHTEHALRALGNFADGEFDPDRLPKINQYVKQWVESQKADPKEVATLVLQGSVGCGKTSQAFCLLRELVLWHAGQGDHYTWYFMTHRRLAAAVQPGSGRDPDALMHRLMTADLVVLDDLGDFNTQDFGRAADATARLINHRAHHRLATVYDTNLPFIRDDNVRALEAEYGPIAVLGDTLDGRAISRLQSGWVIAMPEVDYRAMQGKVFHA
jgi:hypothetical protein